MKKKEEKLREMPCPSEKKTCHVIPEGKFQYNYNILSFPMKLLACSIQFFTDSMKMFSQSARDISELLGISLVCTSRFKPGARAGDSHRR